MIASMTGYGFAEHRNTNMTVSVEIKSLNSKSLDVNIKAPKALFNKEVEIKSIIQKAILRGKVSINIEIENISEEEDMLYIDDKRFSTHYNKLISLAAKYQVTDIDAFSLTISNPDIYKRHVKVYNDKLWHICQKCIKSSLKKLKKMRLEEGKIIKKEFTNRISTILKYHQQIKKLEKSRRNTLKEKMEVNIKKFQGEGAVETEKFNQELFFYLEKIDITEEQLRLKAHCGYFKDTLSEFNTGKKLGFIAQEMLREINTIGSKANHGEIQKIVVNMKDEIEKIKEQLANVL